MVRDKTWNRKGTVFIIYIVVIYTDDLLELLKKKGQGQVGLDEGVECLILSRLYFSYRLERSGVTQS